MRKEVSECMVACPICAPNKTSSNSSAGLLRPVPVPLHPWSDISLDFISSLPISESNSTNLTVVDMLS